MSFDHRERNGARFDSLNKEKSKKFREHLKPSRRTVFYKNRNEAQPSDLMMIAINDRDLTMLIRIGV